MRDLKLTLLHSSLGLLLGFLTSLSFPPYNLWPLSILPAMLLLYVLVKRELTVSQIILMSSAYFFFARFFALRDFYNMIQNKLAKPGLMTEFLYSGIIIWALAWGLLLIIVSAIGYKYFKNKFRRSYYHLIYWAAVFIAVEYLIEFKGSLSPHVTLIGWDFWKLSSSYFGHWGSLVFFFLLAALAAALVMKGTKKCVTLLVVTFTAFSALGFLNLQKHHDKIKLPIIAITAPFPPGGDFERLLPTLKEVTANAKATAKHNLHDGEVPFYIWPEAIFQQTETDGVSYEKVLEFLAKELPGVHGIGVTSLIGRSPKLKSSSMYHIFQLPNGTSSTYKKIFGMPIEEDLSITPFIPKNKINLPMELISGEMSPVLYVPYFNLKAGIFLCNEVAMIKEIVSTPEISEADFYINPSYVPISFPNKLNEMLALYSSWLSAIMNRPVVHISPKHSLIVAEFGRITEIAPTFDGIYFYRLKL